MDKRSIVPPDREDSYTDWQVSPAIVSGEFVFVSGCIGTRSDGSISSVPEEQFRQVFENVGEALACAGASFDHVVEMTTYHVGLLDHIEQFRRVKDEFVGEPFPAWTAIGVCEFVTSGAVVEIRVIARRAA